MRPQLAIVLLAVVCTCHAARLDSTYLPPGSAGSAGGAGFIQPPGRGGGGPFKTSGPFGPGGPGGPGGPSGHGGFGGPGGPGGHGGFGGPGGPGGHGGFGGPSGPGGYGPPSGPGGPGGPGGHGGFGPGGGGAYPGGGPGGGGPRGPGQDIPILSYNNENGGDGNYQFSYETGNGINVQETGHQQGDSESVSGSFSYTGPDGVQYSISYTADEQGFHPQGAHLPTPPPIPPEIQRGVELALAAEARGENQDGSYSGGDGGYSGGDGGYPSGGGGGGHGGGSYQGPNSYQTSSGGGYRY